MALAANNIIIFRLITFNSVREISSDIENKLFMRNFNKYTVFFLYLLYLYHSNGTRYSKLHNACLDRGCAMRGNRLRHFHSESVSVQCSTLLRRAISLKKIEFQFPFLLSSCMQHSINSIGNNNNNGTKQTNCLPMAYARFAAFYLHFTYIVAVCYAIPHMSCTKQD